MDDLNSSIDIKGKLLSYLRSETRNPRITYATPPTPITGGFDTSIYKFQLKGASPDLSRPLVLRIFTRDPNLDRAPFESIIQNSLSNLGYPVPYVYSTSINGDIFGGSFMIMEFLTGQPMINEPEDQIPKMLARAHLDLHSIETTVIENTLRGAGISKEDVSFDRRFNWVNKRIESGGHEWLQPARDWIVDHRPEEPKRLVVIHGDFHPLNILVSKGRVSGVLDWSGFMIGDPALDIAITRFLGTVAFPYYLLHIDWPRLIGIYSEHYLGERLIDSERISFYEVARNLTSLLEGVEGHRGWGQPDTMVRLSKRFKERTGIKISLPN
jgi:aminoglycoside phosphotransferase (APT) family kinase protein